MQLWKYIRRPSALRDVWYYRRNLSEIRRLVDEFAATDTEAARYFDDAVTAYTEGGGFRYDRSFQVYKLISLYRLLKEQDPGTVLELGSGGTTAVLNFWLMQAGDRNIGRRATVFEESEKWQQNTRNVLCRLGGVHSMLEIVHNPRVQLRQTAPRTFRYSQVYDGVPDFLIIDGPSMRVNGVRYEDSYSVDLDEISATGLPRTVVIDNRVATYEYVRSRYADVYSFVPSSNWSMNSEHLCRHSMNFYSVLVRQGIPADGQR